MKTLLMLLALAVAAAPAAAGKLYKWTDKDGNVHYTDQPPPSEAKASERKQFGDKPAADGSLPYALQQAVKSFPVTLYNSDCGDACSKASAFLSKRGVPVTEKNARDAAIAEELKALTGGKLEVPVLKIGSQVVRGYEEGSWNNALDAAGYPKSSMLPAGVANTAAKLPAAKPKVKPRNPSIPVDEPAAAAPESTSSR